MQDAVLFLASAAAIVWSGIKLANYGGVIAAKSRLGGMAVGSILLAGATSLPEIATSVSSSLLALPDIAVGNTLGSNIFNMAIIALADLAEGRGSFFRKVQAGHVLPAAFGMVLSAIVGAAILLDLGLGIAWVGVDTLLLLAVYILATRMLVRFEARRPAEQVHAPVEPTPPVRQSRDRIAGISLARATVGFVIASVVVVAAGTALSITGDRIAAASGLGLTFVGAILIAAATSLPEVVTTVAAVRGGFPDLAMGNVLGSNIFNMVILVLADGAYRQGPILTAVAETHAVVALFGLIMSGMVVIGLFYRSSRTFMRLGVESWALLGAYLLATLLILQTR